MLGSLRDRVDLDHLLASLPADALVARDGNARFVCSPTGAFVLLATHPRDHDAVLHLRTLADGTRDHLARHLAWVPWIDAVAVTPGRAPRNRQVTVVPADLVRPLLVEGPCLLEESFLAQVAGLVGGGDLGGWAPADARMGGWLPPSAPTA